MKKTIFSILAIGIAFLCTGCKAGNGRSETLPVPTENVGAAAQVHLAKFSSEQGYYSMELYQDHPVITYADYETRQHIVLCSRPECQHNDSSCTAYPPYRDRENPPVLRVVNSKLLIMQTSTSEMSPPQIWSADLDGSNAALLCEFPSNWTIDERIYTDEKELYFFANQVDHDTTEMARLIVKVNVTTGKYETLYEMPDQTMTAFILTAFERNLVLEALPLYDGGEMMVECRLFNVDKKALEQPCAQVNNEELGVFAVAQNLYIIDFEKDEIRIEDLATGKSEKVSYAQLYTQVERNKTSLPFVFHAFEDWFRFEFMLLDRSNKNIQEFVMNVRTGEFHEMTLDSSYNNNPILILDELKDILFVRADWVVEGEGLNVRSVIPRYAFISKKDYSTSTANYQYFELFHPK